MLKRHQYISMYSLNIFYCSSKLQKMTNISIFSKAKYLDYKIDLRNSFWYGTVFVQLILGGFIKNLEFFLYKIVKIKPLTDFLFTDKILNKVSY